MDRYRNSEQWPGHCRLKRYTLLRAAFRGLSIHKCRQFSGPFPICCCSHLLLPFAQKSPKCQLSDSSIILSGIQSLRLQCHNSTRMAIINVSSDFCVAKSSGHFSVVILLDLSTSFVTDDSSLTYLLFSRIPYHLLFPPTSLAVIASSTP